MEQMHLHVLKMTIYRVASISEIWNWTTDFENKFEYMFISRYLG